MRLLNKILFQRSYKKVEKSLFCINIHSQLAISTKGYFRPCCNFSGRVRDKKGTPFHASTHSTEEYFFSDSLKEMRSRSIASQPVEGCQSCYNMERATGQSKRTRDNKMYSDVFEELAQSQLKPQVKILDVRMGNLCNLACISCIPSLSSKLDGLWKKHGARSFSDTASVVAEKETGLGGMNWYKKTEAISDLQKSSQKVNYVSFVGGEPFINASYFQFLADLVHRGKSLNLSITSNIMEIREDQLDMIEGFNTKVNCSLDGVDNTLEYIRYPAQFSKVELNFRKLLQRDIQVWVIFTVSIFNLFKIEETYDRLKKICLDEKKNLVMTVGNYVINPGHLCIKNLPQDVRFQAANQLEIFWERVSVESPQERVFLSSLKNLIKYLRNSQGDVEIIRAGWKYVEKYDEVRQKSWRQVAPWLTSILERPQIEGSL